MLSEIRDTLAGKLGEKHAVKRFELLCSALNSCSQMKTSVSPQFTDVFMPVDSVAWEAGVRERGEKGWSVLKDLLISTLPT